MTQIYVSGSLAYDRIMNFPGKFSDHILPDKIHILNVCFLVDGLTENFGGTAGNIAFSLSLLGESPLILAAAGKDFNRYKEWLLRNDLPMDGIRLIQEEFTAGAYITTDTTDNQITGFNPGAMKYASKYRFVPANPHKEAVAIVAPGNVDDMVYYSREYKMMGVPYIFDPGQQIPVIRRDDILYLLTGAALLISNDYELEMIKKTTGLEKKEILQKCPAIITTLGEKGSVLCTRNEQVHIPAVPPDAVVDPTGAGDAYRAGIIKGMVMKKSLTESARMGATCASYAVACYGTQTHRFTQESFWQRYRNQFGN